MVKKIGRILVLLILSATVFQPIAVSASPRLINATMCLDEKGSHPTNIFLLYNWGNNILNSIPQSANLIITARDFLPSDEISYNLLVYKDNEWGEYGECFLNSEEYKDFRTVVPLCEPRLITGVLPGPRKIVIKINRRVVKEIKYRYVVKIISKNEYLRMTERIFGH